MEHLPIEFKGLRIAKQRARSNTDVLLSPGYQILPVTVDLPVPPQPESTLHDYTIDRLRQGLQHVTTRLRRNTTPRTRSFLELQKEAYKISLQAKDDNRETFLSSVQTFETIYHSKTFLKKDFSGVEMERLEAVRKVREYELLGNYGDDLAQEVGGFRHDIFVKQKDENAEELSRARPQLGNKRLWTEVADIMKLEKAKVREWEKEPDDDEFLKNNVTYNLRRLCHQLGLEFEHMKWSIQEYAQRNRKFHNGVNEHIDNCHWTRLAKQVYTDLADLPMVFDKERAAQYERSIKYIRDRYLVRGAFPNDPETWQATPLALKLADKKAEKERDRQGRLKRKAMSEEVKPEEQQQSRREKRKEKRAKLAGVDAGTQTSPQVETDINGLDEFMGFEEYGSESEWERC
ncbi:hypothetical protein MMC30_009144 [Trapelia coarctata]|nr:hypothetical protein [Trapelia coarctata]